MVVMVLLLDNIHKEFHHMMTILKHSPMTDYASEQAQTRSWTLRLLQSTVLLNPTPVQVTQYLFIV